jgi:transcriptional regulator with XRE-family HTH domain
MTLREFADKVKIGQSTLHNYLKGREPKAGMLEKICKHMGADANWLLGLKETPNPGIRLKALKNEVKAVTNSLNKFLKEV